MDEQHFIQQLPEKHLFSVKSEIKKEKYYLRKILSQRVAWEIGALIGEWKVEFQPCLCHKDTLWFGAYFYSSVNNGVRLDGLVHVYTAHL